MNIRSQWFQDIRECVILWGVDIMESRVYFDLLGTYNYRIKTWYFFAGRNLQSWDVRLQIWSLCSGENAYLCKGSGIWQSKSTCTFNSLNKVAKAEIQNVLK